MSEALERDHVAELRRFRPYPDYKKSGVEWIGQMPAHWAIKRLRSTVTGCQNGLWGEDPGEVNDVTCVRVADFDRVALRVKLDEPTLRSVEPKIVQTRGLHPGDLLLEKSGGGDKHPVGVVVLFEYQQRAVCSNFIARMPVEDSFDPRFLAYVHSSMYAARINTRSIKQSTGIQNLDSASYLSEGAGFPNKAEQSVIAAFLDRETAKIDALVAKKERLIELLQEKRTALITRAVTRGLDRNVPMKDSGVEWLGEIPPHWSTEKNRWLFRETDLRSEVGAEQLLTVSHITGVTPRSEKPDVTMIEAESHEGYKICDANQLAINTMWAWMGALGVTKEDGMVSPSYNVYAVTSAELDPKYYDYLCRIPLHVAEIIRRSKGVWRSRLRLYADAFFEIETPLPSMQEQKMITHLLDQETVKIHELIGKNREAIDRLKEFRTALISAAVTGKIDVREEVA